MQQPRIDIHDRDGWTVVTAHGPLDVATAPTLGQRLTELQLRDDRRDERRLVLDLDQVEYLDAFGTGVLVEAARRARAHDTAFVVRCTRPQLLAVLDRSGLGATFEIVASLDPVRTRR